MYQLMNETDQLPASPKSFKSEKQALAYADKLRKLYAMQGYYLTADGRRIAPEDVELAVILMKVFESAVPMCAPYCSRVASAPLLIYP